MNNLPGQHAFQKNDDADNINLKKILLQFTDKWYWFIISILICFSLAYFYTHIVPPVYKINAQLLVSDDEKGGGLGKQAGGLMDLGGLLGSSNSVDNEVAILKTRFLMEQVARQMALNIIYSKEANLARRELDQVPFNLEIVKSADTIKATELKLKKAGNNKFQVETKSFQETVQWNQVFDIKGVGSVRIVPVAGQIVEEGQYYVDLVSLNQRVSQLLKSMTVMVSAKQTTIIDLTLNYPLEAKGERILRTLIEKYTAANLSDKNAIADSTYKFIRERINVISTELGDVENQVESFKQNNKLSDMTAQGKLLVESSGEFSNELAKAETQVSILNDLESYLKDEAKNKRVFPTSLLPSDMVFSDLMAQYNTLLIDRDRQLLSVKEGSPFIQNLDTQIAGLRNGILNNIISTKNSYVVTRDKLRRQVGQAENKISGVPQIEKNYLKLARNQKIKEELYIFLMQKAEETAISKTGNISVAKVIDPPKAEETAVSPKKNIIYLIAIFFGIGLAIVIILVRNALNNAITNKDDITSATDVPVIGEIGHNVSADNLIVANNGRSAVAEQFRALRANLSFYLKDESQKVILLTSSMSSEGKSFSAINLGNIFALSGKKVLLMELDLRKPGLSNKFDIENRVGFSNFTIDNKLQTSDIIQPLKASPNLFIISSGPLPPNPSETLMSERTDELILKLKEEFDYIIMDAPPIGIIADAQQLYKYADITLYVVRQKVTLKNQLKIVDELYRSEKMSKMAIVVNDIDNKLYGYGEGYGNYGQEAELSISDKVKRLFKR